MKSKMKTIIICKLLLFFQYSQINREFFEAQSKLSNQGLREELKLEFPKTFGNSLSFVNLKNEHTQGVFVNMTTKQTQSVSLFSNAGDITKTNINNNNKEVNSKPPKNFSTFRRTKTIDEEY